MSKTIQWSDLPTKYQTILTSRLDSNMNRELYSKDGLTIYEDEDFAFAEDMKLLKIYPEDGEFEITIKENT